MALHPTDIGGIEGKRGAGKAPGAYVEMMRRRNEAATSHWWTERDTINNQYSHLTCTHMLFHVVAVCFAVN